MSSGLIFFRFTARLDFMQLVSFSTQNSVKVLEIFENTPICLVGAYDGTPTRIDDPTHLP